MLHLKDRLSVSLVTLVLVGCSSGSELTKPSIGLSSDAVVETAPAITPKTLQTAQTLVSQDQTVIKTSGEEYFSEDKYGVKASPRVAGVTALAMNSTFDENGASLVSYAGKAGLAPPPSKLKRGGGRAQIGKPYTIRGTRFVPRKQPNYNRTGNASWYGSAFHGRLTANGEVYDMNHLTAAHPTLPLPSYVRVTNVSNGRSVIVRVNDRGPFAKNRIIDLSRRAALALGTTKAGVAKVNVKYVGPAPVHGQDDAYLLASYRGPGVQGGTDQVIAALPQPTSAEDKSVVAVSPLSFASSTEMDVKAPYQVQNNQIFVPSAIIDAERHTAWQRDFGAIEQTPHGVLITLDKLADSNGTLKHLWAQGFKDAMFMRP